MTDVDLFGQPLPQQRSTSRPTRRVSNDLDEVRDVLGVAIRTGYVLDGNRVWRCISREDIEPVPRQEADVVHQLLDTGWLHLGRTRSYRHGTEHVQAHALIVPRHTRAAALRWDSRKRAGGRPGPSPSGQHMSPTRRVLVTGSREWTDAESIRAALADVWGDGTAVLVTGGCPRGADRIAEKIWTGWGGRIERHPADWGEDGRAAGPRRNEEMVQAGAEVCLAFIRDHSAGASHTARLAEAAGIPTRRHVKRGATR